MLLLIESVINSFLSTFVSAFGGSQRNHHHSLKLQPGKRGFYKAQRDRAATPGDLGAEGEGGNDLKVLPLLVQTQGDGIRESCEIQVKLHLPSGQFS